MLDDLNLKEIKDAVQTIQNKLIKLEKLEIQNNIDDYDSEIKLINRKFKTNFDADSIYLTRFQASDNLVSRSYRKWHKTTLEQIAKRSEGVPVITDHTWSAHAAIGFVYKTEIITLDSIPQDYQQTNGYAKINKKIVQREGLIQVLSYLAVLKSSGYAEKIESNIVASCSTGGFIDNVSAICPVCSERLGREVDFFEKDKNGEYICPHDAPFSFINPMYNDTEIYNFAPYVELRGEYDAIELSLVINPNLPQAKKS